MSGTTSKDRRPNWDTWRLMPIATLQELIALSMDIDPEKVRYHRDGWMANSDLPAYDEGNELNSRAKIVLRNTDSFEGVSWSSPFYRSVVKVPSFVRWILGARLTVPSEFVSLLGDDVSRQEYSEKSDIRLDALRAWAQGKSDEHERLSENDVAEAYRLTVAKIDELRRDGQHATQEACAGDADSTPSRIGCVNDIGKSVIAPKKDVLDALVMAGAGDFNSKIRLRDEISRTLRNPRKLGYLIAKAGGPGGNPPQQLHVVLVAQWLVDSNRMPRNTVVSRLTKTWPQLTDFVEDYFPAENGIEGGTS